MKFIPVHLFRSTCVSLSSYDVYIYINFNKCVRSSFTYSASIKYSLPSEMDGTRLLAVCDVALGSCLDLYERDYSLNDAPSGFDSVHGVRKTADISSDFEVLILKCWALEKAPNFGFIMPLRDNRMNVTCISVQTLNH